MKKLLILMVSVLWVAALADVPIRVSYNYLGDRSPDSLHILVVDMDGDTLADSSWGSGVGDVLTDTVFPGIYGFDIAWSESKYYHTYIFWRQGTTTDSGHLVDEGFNGPFSVGSDLVTIYTRDTANDVFVGFVKVTLYNHIDTTATYAQLTNGSGYAEFNITPTDTFLISAGDKFGYIFSSLDSMFVTGTYYDTIMGYALSPTTAGTDKVCVVRVEVQGPDGLPAKHVRVEASVDGHNIVDSSGTPLYETTMGEFTNDNGYVDFNCIWSSYLLRGDSTNIPWYFRVVKGPEKELVVPRLSTYTVSFRKE